MSYSFEHNLKQVSHSPTDYLKEWSQEEVIVHDERTSERRCICNRPIKVAHICRNEITKNVVKMGSSCVKKILGLDDDIGKARQIAKKNNIRLFEKGIYVDITDMTQYVLDVLRDYMLCKPIQYIMIWLDMYKTNPIMMAVIQMVYDQKLRHQEEETRRQQEANEKEAQRQQEAAEQELRRQKETAEKEAQRQQEAAEQEEQRQLEYVLYQREVAKQYALRQLDIQREMEEQMERQRKREDGISKRRLYDQEYRSQMDKNNTCHCLLKHNEICRCSAPRFKLSHIPPYEDCSFCFKWKCRCGL